LEEIKPATNVKPCARSFHKMVSWGHFLYVFGGCAETGRLNDFYQFDTVKREWMEMPLSTEVTARGGPSIGIHENYFIVAAGFNGDENDDIHQFNFTSQKWSKLSSGKFRARSVAPTCQINNHMFIFGGEVRPSQKQHQGAGDFEEDLVSININDGSVISCVNKGQETPICRGWTSMAPLDEKNIILFGGLTGTDENPQRLGDTWILTFL